MKISICVEGTGGIIKVPTTVVIAKLRRASFFVNSAQVVELVHWDLLQIRTVNICSWPSLSDTVYVCVTDQTIYKPRRAGVSAATCGIVLARQGIVMLNLVQLDLRTHRLKVCAQTCRWPL